VTVATSGAGALFPAMRNSPRGPFVDPRALLSTFVALCSLLTSRGSAQHAASVALHSFRRRPRCFCLSRWL
jgi:hypothetical protein